MSPLPGLIHLLRVTDAACVQPLAEPPWYATLTIHTYIPDNGRDAFGCSSMSVCTLTKQNPDSPVYATGVTARSRPRPRSSRPDKLKVVMAFNRPVYFFNLISNPQGATTVHALLLLNMVPCPRNAAEGKEQCLLRIMDS